MELLLPEGATPIADSGGLKLPWIKTRDQLNEVEAENILKAAIKYFSRRRNPLKWFSERGLKNIHREMFGDVWDWAGVYYKGPLRNIGMKYYQIPLQIHELCKDVHYWLEQKTDLNILQQSARIHFRLAQIHPFHNGNGRHARLVADLYLKSLGGQIPHWPEKILITNSNARKEYINSLKKADRGEYHYLENLIIQCGGRNP